MILFENDTTEVICVDGNLWIYDDVYLTGIWRIDQHNNLQVEIECSYTGKWMFFTKTEYTNLWLDDWDIQFIEKAKWTEFKCSKM